MSDLEWLRAKEDERKALEAKLLRGAKEDAHRRGKEPFDFRRLLEIFDPSSDSRPGSDLPDPPKTADDLERRYYLDFPEVLTIADFARKLEEARPFR